MLDDSCIRHIMRCIVDYRITLIVRHILNTSLERDRTPIKSPVFVVEELIELPGVNKTISCLPKPLP